MKTNVPASANDPQKASDDFHKKRMDRDANGLQPRPAGHISSSIDQSPLVQAQLKRSKEIHGSDRVHAIASLANEINCGAPPAQLSISPSPNETGLPDQLKNGVESLSGYSLGAGPQVQQSEAETVQRVIGDAGAANTGRVAFDRNYVLARITGVTPPTYMGPKWAKDPTIYGLKFYNNGDTGYALGQDPNYWLAEKKDEAEYVKKYSKLTGNLIPLRSPVLQGLADGGYVLDAEAGTIRPASGGAYNGVYSFVITVDGALGIGDSALVGHTGLAKGNAVLMAGELTITGGKVTYKGCRTGHYYTRAEEEVRGLEVMKSRYSWIAGLSPKGHGDDAPSGLQALGLGPGIGTFGHQNKMEENFAAAKALWTKHKTDIWVVDVLMQSMTETIKKYMKTLEEAESIDAEVIAVLTRKVEITGEMLRDLEQAIQEHERGEGDMDRPVGMTGYDGSDPFEEG